MKKPTIIGIGEILWDEFPGKKILGGAPANFALHANQLGGHGKIISCIGDDVSGDEIKKKLTQNRLSYKLSIDPAHPTGHVSVQTDDKGSPQYIIHENVSWDYLPFDSDTKKLAHIADAICFGTLAQRNPISAQSIKKFIKSTSQACIKIYDINLRQHYYSKNVISDLMKLSNVLKLNNEELDIITKMFFLPKKETHCLEKLKSLFCIDIIILTKGKEGSRIFKDRLNDSQSCPEPIRIVDTVGAGDSYTAAFAIALIKKCDLDQINRAASKIAAFVCSQSGATPIIPQDIVQSLFKKD